MFLVAKQKTLLINLLISHYLYWTLRKRKQRLKWHKIGQTRCFDWWLIYDSSLLTDSYMTHHDSIKISKLSQFFWSSLVKHDSCLMSHDSWLWPFFIERDQKLFHRRLWKLSTWPLSMCWSGQRSNFPSLGRTGIWLVFWHKKCCLLFIIFVIIYLFFHIWLL